MPMIEPPSGVARALTASSLVPWRRDLFVGDGRSHRHPVDAQQRPLAVVRLHQDPDGPVAGASGGGADAALELVADHPGPATDVALRHRSGGSRRERGVDVLGAHVEPVDVVEGAVVGLTGDGERPDGVAHVVRPCRRLDQGVVHDTDAVGVGDADGTAEHPGLPDPLQPGELAVAVEPVRPGEHRLGPYVAVVGDHHGDPGSHRPLAGPQPAVTADQRGVADADTGDIGDGVEGAGFHAPDSDAEVSGAHRRSVAVLMALRLKPHRCAMGDPQRPSPSSS